MEHTTMVHPGAVLADELEERSIAQSASRDTFACCHERLMKSAAASGASAPKWPSNFRWRLERVRSSG